MVCSTPAPSPHGTRWRSKATRKDSPRRSTRTWESTSAPRPRRPSSSTPTASPLAGFYTRTLGSPLTAVQAICEAIEDWQARTGCALRFLGVGTTGAGRKFVGSIVRADLVVDEITAHARAAYALDPAIDTIIEIGGQDAKFTTMRDGMVTFSHMNTVCAAGTGSFLEEQAARLGCEPRRLRARVTGVRAPLSSDRCAVFMERDINNFLSQGFSTDEILAAALYSVRDNYLTKVARGAAIGERIAFQGATARNAALVAAFRDGLGKPILVSKYCHLTGALGVALLLAENGHASSRFLGLAGAATGDPRALGNLRPVRQPLQAEDRNGCRGSGGVRFPLRQGLRCVPVRGQEHVGLRHAEGAPKAFLQA